MTYFFAHCLISLFFFIGCASDEESKSDDSPSDVVQKVEDTNSELAPNPNELVAGENLVLDVSLSHSGVIGDGQLWRGKIKRFLFGKLTEREIVLKSLNKSDIYGEKLKSAESISDIRISFKLSTSKDTRSGFQDIRGRFWEITKVETGS